MSERRISPAETGISHPLTNCAVVCTDDGRIILQAGDAAGIVLDEKTGVISIYGSAIRFISDDLTINGRKLSFSSLESKHNSNNAGAAARRIETLGGSK